MNLGYGERFQYGEGYYKGEDSGILPPALAGNLFLEQYKERENLHFFYGGLNHIIEDTKNKTMLYQNGTFGLEFAKGELLDFYGKNHKVNRAGRNDEEYRAYIKLKIAEKYTAGTPNRIIEQVKELLKAERVEYIEVYPASVYLAVSGRVIPNESGIKQISSILPAGIGFNLDYNEEDDTSGFFGFLEDSEALGFSEEGYLNDGGTFFEEIL